jgi:hypothetical protein
MICVSSCKTFVAFNLIGNLRWMPQQNKVLTQKNVTNAFLLKATTKLMKSKHGDSLNSLNRVEI